MSEDANPARAGAAGRELSPEESARLWARLRQRWGPIGPSGPYWYPLNGQLGGPNALVFRADAFDDALPVPVLRRILTAHGVGRVWVLRDIGPLGTDHEVACHALEPYGSDAYTTADDLDWLLYSSHEDTLAIGGAWLIVAIKEAWLRWRDGLWAVPSWWRRPHSAH